MPKVGYVGLESGHEVGATIDENGRGLLRGCDRTCLEAVERVDVSCHSAALLPSGGAVWAMSPLACSRVGASPVVVRPVLRPTWCAPLGVPTTRRRH